MGWALVGVWVVRQAAAQVAVMPGAVGWEAVVQEVVGVEVVAGEVVAAVTGW